MKRILFLLFFTGPLVLLAQKEFQKKFQTALIETENNTVIEMPEGTYTLDASLWLDGKQNVVIKGAGMDKTILNFKGQISGAEGIKVTNAANITLQDLTVQNTKGDAIKTQQVEGITFSHVKVEWTGGPDKDNGSYGLYPVQCTNVLIDHCTAVGASDAGIYVGQSNHIIVKNCRAYQNVAGIEIENSQFADVYDNEVFNNTGGILVFDLPDLIQKEGGHIRVFTNEVYDNNLSNFAPKGNIVAKVPPGTGVMVLATRHVEIFNNRIVNNITASTAVVSYYMTELPIHDKTYKPFPDSIYIHDNLYKRPNVRTTAKGRMGKMFRLKLRFGKKVPHILFDGIKDPSKPQRAICIRNNENATFVNMDAENGFKNKSFDIQLYDCAIQPIQPVALTENSQ